MHLIERYSLGCGAKIDKPSIIEKYFPLVVEKYITIHPASKFQAKCYDWWNEVTYLLKPILDKAGITIVQIGTKADPALKGCYHTHGQTNIGQVAYILRKSLLHLGVDSFPIHVASSYSDKKIVGLYSNSHAKNVRPYWGKPDNHRLLEPTRTGKPSFSAHENPKSINTIKPEEVALSVCELLGLDFKPEFISVLFGDFYSNQLIESVPDSLVDISKFGIDCLIMRMDFVFNEQILAQQLSICPCSITTDKPINIDLIKGFQGRIRDVVYILDDNHNPEFVEKLHKLNINYNLVTFKTGKELEILKTYYMDYKIIHVKDLPTMINKPQLKDKNLGEMYYKSSKYILSKGKMFASKADWQRELSMDTMEYSPRPIINCQAFHQEIENFYILTKN